MTLYHRLLRRLGYDTVEKLTHTMPVYEYRVIHTNGDVSEVIGHGYNTDDAFARFYEYKGCYHSEFMGWSVWPGNQEIRRVLESIKEIKEERIGTTTFTAVVDKADGETIETDVTTETE